MKSDRDIIDRIIKSLGENSVNVERITEKIKKKYKKNSKMIYRDLLKIFTNLDFNADEANKHWNKILEQKALLSKRLKRDVGLRVAMLDYFIHKNKMLKNPKIIEIEIFDKLSTSVITDELTHLYNKRFFTETLYRETLRAKRYNLDLSVLMLDIDDFKRCNDKFGHLFGDRVLAQIADILEKNIRKVDYVCRYGGEEFAIIFPETPGSGALAVAERVRKMIQTTKFVVEDIKAEISLTISGGISSFGIDDDTPEGLVKKSDIALYQAKNDGKNRVYLFYEEKRKFFRIDARCEVTYHILTEAEYEKSETRNISGGGILFECDELIPIGSLIEISIKIPGTRRKIKAIGKTTRLEEKTLNKYEVGVIFTKIDPLDQSNIIKYVSHVHEKVNK